MKFSAASSWIQRACARTPEGSHDLLRERESGDRKFHSALLRLRLIAEQLHAHDAGCADALLKWARAFFRYYRRLQQLLCSSEAISVELDRILPVH